MYFILCYFYVEAYDNGDNLKMILFSFNISFHLDEYGYWKNGKAFTFFAVDLILWFFTVRPAMRRWGGWQGGLLWGCWDEHNIKDNLITCQEANANGFCWTIWTFLWDSQVINLFIVEANQLVKCCYCFLHV